MEYRGFWLALGLSFVVNGSGCASTTYQVRPGLERPAFAGKVLVYEQQMPPDVQFVVMGDFLEQRQWYGDTDQTAREAIHAAAAKGANGILVERSGQRPTAWSWLSPYTEGKLLWISNYKAAAAALGGKQSVPSTAERLRELDELHQKGLITDGEYEAKRKAIVDSL